MVTLEIRKTLNKRLQNLRETYTDNLDKVRKSFEDEPIHDLRVSIRRILAFMSFMNEMCGKEINPELFSDLKKKIKRFNKLRDAQVQLNFLINNLKKYPELLDFICNLKRKEKKQVEILKSFIFQSEFNLSGEIFFYQNNLKTLECLELLTIRDIGKIAYKSLFEVKNALESIKYGEYDTYHKVRLKIKKFRYIIETIEQIIQSPKEKLKSIQELQTLLGDIQDLTVLLALLDKFCQKKQLNVSIFLNFVEFIKQKREEKEKDFWENVKILEFWDNYLLSF